MENTIAEKSILTMFAEVGKAFAYQRVCLAQTKPNWFTAWWRRRALTAVTSSEVAIAVFQKQISWVAARLHSLLCEWNEPDRAEYQKLAHEAISMAYFNDVQKVEFHPLKEVTMFTGVINHDIETLLRLSPALHYYLGVTPSASFPLPESEFRNIMLGFRKQLLELDLNNKERIALMLYYIGTDQSFDISEKLRAHYTRGALN